VAEAEVPARLDDGLTDCTPGRITAVPVEALDSAVAVCAEGVVDVPSMDATGMGTCGFAVAGGTFVDVPAGFAVDVAGVDFSGGGAESSFLKNDMASNTSDPAGSEEAATG